MAASEGAAQVYRLCLVACPQALLHSQMSLVLHRAALKQEDTSAAGCHRQSGLTALACCAQGLQARQSLPGGEPGAHSNHHSPRGSGAQHMSSRAREEQEGLAQLCRGHVQQLKVYGFR